jgi:hypothetical protein
MLGPSRGFGMKIPQKRSCANDFSGWYQARW